MSENKIERPVDNRKRIKKIERQFEIIRTVLAISIAILIVLVVILLVSKTPMEAITTLLLGPIRNLRQMGNVVLLAIPLIFTGIGTSVIFKSNRFNMASDGAFYFGSMIAAVIGIKSNLPPFLTVILILVAGLVSGVVLGFIPAYLNKKFRTSELVVSLMLNYIVGFYVLYVFNYVIRDTGSTSLESLPLRQGVSLGTLIKMGRVDIHWGLAIAVVLAILAYIVLFKTRWGYALRSTGENEKFSKYVGIKTGVVVVMAQVIGVGIAGLGGAVEMIGRYTTFRFQRSPGYGFDGVLIAALCKNNPLFVPFGAFFLAYIRVGADMVNLNTDVPSEVIFIVQATIILLISATSFLSKWKQAAINKETMKLQGEGQ